MEIDPITIYYYQATSGRCPFKTWFDSLDEGTQLYVDARLTRVRRGLLGKNKNLAGGVWELKIDTGPGYRIYYGRDGKTVVILLCAGHKKTQSKDIKAARENWADYSRRERR